MSDRSASLSKGLKNKLAGQVAEYRVCAELARRELIATPFAGNVPTYDVLATDVNCRTVPIQVKATTGDNWRTDATKWMEINLAGGVQIFDGLKTIANPDLIYVCVAIASIGMGSDRFFI